MKPRVLFDFPGGDFVPVLLMAGIVVLGYLDPWLGVAALTLMAVGLYAWLSRD